MKIFDHYKGLPFEIYIICLCKIIDKMGSLVGPMFTLILSSKLGFNATTIASMMLVFSIISLPLGLIGGKLADCMNKKLLINICDIISSIIFIACGFMKLSITTIVIYLIGSLLQSLESPAYSVLMADTTNSKDRERAYSLGYLSTNLGLILAPTIGGFLLKDHINLMFIISGITQLLSIIVFDIFIKETKVKVDKDNKYEQLKEDVNLLIVFKENMPVLLFINTLAMSFLVYNQFSYLLPLHLSSIFVEEGSVYYGTISSVNCIVVLVFTSLTTRLIKDIQSLDKIAIGMCLEVIGYIMFALFIKHIWVCYIACVIFTIGEIVETISTSPFVLNRVPANYRGRINAFSDTFTSLFVSLFAIVVGKIYDGFGANFTWLITIVLGIITTISFLLIKRIDKKRYPELY